MLCREYNLNPLADGVVISQGWMLKNITGETTLL